MCGLGIVFQPLSDRSDIEASLSALDATQQHRGPDGCARYVQKLGSQSLLGMTHQRLAILDLSSKADQPMHSACGRYVLCYNGEIYNYKELAVSLGMDGRFDASRGDTAVLLEALIRWGVQALPKLNGMWAFVLFDRVHRTLLISRDRLGVKPLYWSVTNGRLLLASEVKGVLALAQTRFAINKDRVLSHLVQSLGNTDCSTMFEGIEAVPAGSYAHINLMESAREPQFHRYWWHPYELGDPVVEHTTPDELRELLIDSVRLRLRSDVSCGLLLSGGIDSSSILSAARELGSDLRVLSAVSKDPLSNEEYWVNQIARHYQIKPTWVKIDDEPLSILDDLPLATWHNDQPLAGLSMIAHRRLMAAAQAQGIVVLLSGQGADEQLGGYNKFLYFYLRQLLSRGNVPKAAALLWSCFKRGTVLSEFSFAEAKRYLPIWAVRSGEHLGPALSSARSVATSHQTSYAEREWLDLASLSLPMLLHSEDRMSMSCSREVRLPFVDYRLVEMFATIPAAQKFNRGWPKWPLRHAMRNLMPMSVSWRRDKKGFNIPEAQWLKTSFRPRIDALLASNMRAADLGLLDPVATRKLYENYCSGDSRVSYKEILNVVTLEAWLQVYGDRLRT